MRKLIPFLVLILFFTSCTTTVVQIGPQETEPMQPSYADCVADEMNPPVYRDLKDPMGVRASTLHQLDARKEKCMKSLDAQNHQNYNAALYYKQKTSSSFWTGFLSGAGAAIAVIITVVGIVASHG